MSVSCRDYTTELVCYNDGTTSKQLIAHYEYAKGSNNSILLATRYTEADGVTVVDTTTGTVTAGECCKKEIFATHQKFYEVPDIQDGMVAYELTNNLTTQGLDAFNSYFHLIYPTLNGSAGVPIGIQLTEYFSNTQDGILWTNIAGVQAVIDFVLPSMNLNVGDVVYAINTSNLPIFFLSPSAVTELANNTYLHIYWGALSTHNNYNEKADVTVIASNSNILLGAGTKCIGIQQIKEKDTCTNLETYRYIIEDGTGNLVDVTDIIPNFDENKVLFKCAEPLPILEKEICGTIDGSIDNYELIKIYTREPLTGVQNIIHYEDKFGNIVTGEVVEVCCNCNSLCSLPTLLLNRVCFGYAGSFNGDVQFPQDKAISGADIFIEYLEVNNNILINSQTNIGNTGAATFSDMGYGIAYDSVVNLLNNNALINSNDIRFVTAGNILADRGWGIEYNDAKSYRIVISDFITASSATQFWTIVLNPTEQWEGIGNGAVGNNWTLTDFTNNTGTAFPFNACNII